MLYALGDSFTYGFNFKEEQERTESVWPFHLANLLATPYQNLALPGGSNWRMARLITTLPITEEDVVVIGLSDSKRFEFGVSPNHNPPSPTKLGDVNEVDGDLITKRFFPALYDRTIDDSARTFIDLAFNKFRNDRWYKSMHIIMCSAIAYRLQEIGCRWVMFDTWMPNPRLDIANYILPGITMYQFLFGTRDPEFLPIRYWNKKEHMRVATTIFENMEGTYSTILPQAYNPSTDLDKFY